MSNSAWTKKLLLEGTDPKCECGEVLLMSSNGFGTLMERCPNGCFAGPVQIRRPACPECGGGPWDEKRGCEGCGHGVRKPA